VTSTPVAAGSASPVSSAPTERTDADKSRDAALAPKAEAILDAFFNTDPIQVDGPTADVELSPDGKRLLFRSNRSGAMEVFVSDPAKPSEPPTKIVGGPERIRSAQFAVDGRFVLFRRDAGADEAFHIFRCKPDGSDAVDLTPSEVLRRERPLLPRLRPDIMVYSGVSTRAKEAKLFVQTLSNGQPRLVYTDPGAALSADVNPAGTHA
jgi:Tol biopolymer transport system component